MFVKLQKWQEELSIAVKTSHLIILHGNVLDEIYWGNKLFSSLEEWLIGLGGWHDISASYNLAAGIVFFNGGTEARQIIHGQGQNQSNQNQALLQAAGISLPQDGLPKEPVAALEALDKLLAQKEKKVFLILEYAETLVGDSAGRQPTLVEQSIVIRLKSWARKAALHSAGHLIILVVRQLSGLDKGLRDTQLGVVAIRLNKPNEAEREILLNLWRVNKDKIKQIAHITAGLGIKQTRQLVENSNGDLFSRIIAARQKCLAVEYGHLFRFIEPEFGLEAVGGLDAIVAKLRKVVSHMRSGRINLVPQGILLAGPPRTGKTVLARGLAKEAKVLYVELLSLRNKWVGESERIQEELECAVSELSPLVIFVDEVDGRFGERSGYRGDGGVAEGELSAILGMTSDTSKQGKVLWIFACNKPSLLDKAFREPGRMDLRIPVLPPQTAQQRADIFKVMLLQCRCQADSDISWLDLANLVANYTGGDIRRITQMALEEAFERDGEIIQKEDYETAIKKYLKPLADEDIQKMTIAAIRETSSTEFLTEEMASVLREQ